MKIVITTGHHVVGLVDQDFLVIKAKVNKTWVNDPLGDGRTYGRATCAKTMIAIGRDCGSTSWIKICISQFNYIFQITSYYQTERRVKSTSALSFSIEFQVYAKV